MADEAQLKPCFVISPIGEVGSDTRKRSSQVFKHIIEPAARACGYRATWAFQISDVGTITHQVIERLLYDPMVIADLTDHNPNVFYELAIRHIVRKPMVQMIQHGQAIPFDVATQRTIKVDFPDPDGIVAALEELQQHIRSAEKDPSLVDNPISSTIDLISLRGSGNPEAAQLADVLEGIAGLRRDVAELREAPRARPSANDRPGPGWLTKNPDGSPRLIVPVDHRPRS
jgi:hypothetical protein